MWICQLCGQCLSGSSALPELSKTECEQTSLQPACWHQLSRFGGRMAVVEVVVVAEVAVVLDQAYQ